MISRKQETNHKYMFLSTNRMWWQKNCHKIRLTIKFLLVLTNDTGGNRHAGVGFKLSMKIGWSDNQETVMSDPVN